MPADRLTAGRLWAIPRVGSPEPLPDGSACLVPVTTYDPKTDETLCRFWHVAVDDRRARPLTSVDATTSALTVSHDGRYVAFLRKPGGSTDERGAGPSHPDQTQVYVLDLQGGEAQRMTDLPLGADGVRWAPDGRLVLVAAVFADARTLQETTERKAERAKDTVTALVSEDRVVRYWDHWLVDGTVHHLFVLDPSTGVLSDLMPGATRWLPLSKPGASFDIAPDSSEVAFTACRTAEPHQRLLWGVFRVPMPARDSTASAAADPDPDRDPAELLSSDDDTTNAAAPLYDPTGMYLFYGLQQEFDFYGDRVRLVAHDLAGGTGEVVAEDWDLSPDAWAFDRDEPGYLWLTADSGGRTALYRLDLHAALGLDSGGVSPDVTPVAMARGGTFQAPRIAAGRLFITTHALNAPPEVFIADVTSPAGEQSDDDGFALRRLTDFTAAAMTDVELGAVSEIVLDGHGGDPVQAFVVWPPHREAASATAGPNDQDAPTDKRTDHPSGKQGPLPLVHLIHGGPHGSFGDGWHWRWSAQVFASHGLLCALVNFHGSTGWGDAYTRSILGRWGDQPAADIEAATDELLARGWVDPERMAIAGGSYGGYLVSWLCTRTDRYACAVNHAGVTDFQTQFASDMTQGRPRSFGGELWDDLDGLDRYNPMRHAANLRTPMLVLHGQRDYRVPYAQGLQIYAVYKARGLPARLVIYPDENHWILKRGNSMHWYGEVLAWLRRWLGEDTVVVAIVAIVMSIALAACNANPDAHVAPIESSNVQVDTVEQSARLTDDERAVTEFNNLQQSIAARANRATPEEVEALWSLRERFGASEEVFTLLNNVLVARHDYHGLRRLYEGRPDLSAAQRFTLGKIYVQLGAWDAAASTLVALADESPGDPEVGFHAAMALRSQGRVAEAAALLDPHLAALERSGNVDALTIRGSLYLQAEQPDEAFTMFERAIALEPGSSAAVNGQGRALAALGRRDEAAAAFATVEAIHSERNAETARKARLSARATALEAAFGEGDMVEAERLVDAMLQEASEPDLRATLHEYAARIYDATGRTDAAATAQAAAAGGTP